MNRKFYDQPSLYLSLIVTLALAAVEVPFWISIFCSLLFLWKWLVEKMNFGGVSRFWTSLLSVVLFVVIYIQRGEILAQIPSMTLLMGLAALKVMDYQNQRDHKFLVLFGFVLVALKSIFSVDLYAFVPGLLAFFGFWISLYPQKTKGRWLLISRTAVLAFPLLGLLFFAFPRIVVPWAMKRGAPTATMGFSGEVAPGSISRLAQNNQLVFRAQLFDRVETASSLYWRGNVLTRSYGLYWPFSTPANSRVTENLPADLLNPKQSFEYEVILEPGSKGFLFTLDGAISVSSTMFAVEKFRHQVYRTQPFFRKSQSYRARSVFPLENVRRIPHVLPTKQETAVGSLGPKSDEWVKDIRNRFADSKDRLRQLETFFSQKDFVYTLSPGVYLKNDLDEFLFERRKGFCEHFAGAYASLARALGIPSRVVVGYQGGRFNLVGNFWAVTQRDAHAWVEVYVDGHWQRVDPTEWVAPLRLSMGGQDFFILSLQEQMQWARLKSWRRPGESDLTVLQALDLWMENVNYLWTSFILDFSASDQRELWEEGLKTIGLFVLIGVLSVVFALNLLRQISRRRFRKSEMDLLTQKIFQWGANRGVAYLPGQAPLSYLRELERGFSSQKEFFQKFSDFYERVKYLEEECSKAQVKGLLREWKQVQSKES